VIFDRALTLLERQLQRRKLGHARRPKPATAPVVRSRSVPAHARREVWERDAGQCAFIGTDGRCPERGFLEFHHVVPFAAGGPTTVANVQLRCRGHNGLEAERFFGRRGPSVVRERAVPYRSDWFELPP
jgi:5-methylcytosine-specific restriction endonuclease McrA